MVQVSRAALIRVVVCHGTFIHLFKKFLLFLIFTCVYNIRDLFRPINGFSNINSFISSTIFFNNTIN